MSNLICSACIDPCLPGGVPHSCSAGPPEFLWWGGVSFQISDPPGVWTEGGKNRENESLTLSSVLFREHSPSSSVLPSTHWYYLMWEDTWDSEELDFGRGAIYPWFLMPGHPFTLGSLLLNWPKVKHVEKPSPSSRRNQRARFWPGFLGYMYHLKGIWVQASCLTAQLEQICTHCIYPTHFQITLN